MLYNGAMAKKKTKKTGAKPVDDALAERRRLDDVIRNLEDAQAARAVERAIRWARLLDQLEVFLSIADELFTIGIPVDHQKVWSEHEARKELGEAVTLGEVYRFYKDVEDYFFDEDLRLAENWLPMIGAKPLALADVRARLGGREPHDPFATPGEAIASAIGAVRKLLDADLARARSFESVPTGSEIDLLRRIGKGPKTAKELAVEIAGKGRPYAEDEKRVSRAILDKLRAVHRFDIPNERGLGYTLSPSDRARLDRLVGGT